MKKVVFCEVTWMKYYGGVTEEDRPKNGGKYIAENETGGEVYNFSPYNHKCYGYVMHYGEELHIERYDKILKSSDDVRDMTVVWVASDGKNSKIVGWYEHATMYRYWQSYCDISFAGDMDYYYNFVANEKDCYLIAEEDRSFVIPRASKAGKGKGMGQSQVWYADSVYAQNEFIPKVLEYLESMKDKGIPFTLDETQISSCVEDHGQSVDELLAFVENWFAESNGNIYEAFNLINLAVSKEDSFRTREFRAKLYSLIGLYDEAEEEYKLALYHEENLEAMLDFMYIELMLNHTFLAIELGEKIRTRKKEAGVDIWETAACNLVRAYTNEYEFDKAELLIIECEQEKNKNHTWIEDLKEYLKIKKNERKSF